MLFFHTWHVFAVSFRLRQEGCACVWDAPQSADVPARQVGFTVTERVYAPWSVRRPGAPFALLYPAVMLITWQVRCASGTSADRDASRNPSPWPSDENGSILYKRVMSVKDEITDNFLRASVYVESAYYPLPVGYQQLKDDGWMHGEHCFLGNLFYYLLINIIYFRLCNFMCSLRQCLGTWYEPGGICVCACVCSGKDFQMRLMSLEIVLQKRKTIKFQPSLHYVSYCPSVTWFTAPKTQISSSPSANKKKIHIYFDIKQKLN